MDDFYLLIWTIARGGQMVTNQETCWLSSTMHTYSPSPAPKGWEQTGHTGTLDTNSLRAAGQESLDAGSEALPN